LQVWNSGRRFKTEFGVKMEEGSGDDFVEDVKVWLRSSFTAVSGEDVDRRGVVVPQYSVSRLVPCSRDYWSTLGHIPPGYRLSVLDEIAYLIRMESRLRAQGHSRRETLDERLFDEFFCKKNWVLQWTHAMLRAPNSARDFRRYSEPVGRHQYYRADLVLGEETVVEGIRIPAEGKIVEWDESLRVPRITSTAFEADHTTHFYFNPYQREVAILLGRDRCAEEKSPCLDVVALYGRHFQASFCAYRLFKGALQDSLIYLRRTVSSRTLC
jgi:hypothetical protein